MKDAVYLGRVIDARVFRAYVYSTDGSKTLVNSWHEFERMIATGNWFESMPAPASKEEAAEVIETPVPEKEEKPKPRRKAVKNANGS